MQTVRSYKIRGAYNKMASMTAEALAGGVVCASAGNHAQGVAYACRKMEVKGAIFMPTTTPAQKVKQVRLFGQEWIEIHWWVTRMTTRITPPWNIARLPMLFLCIRLMICKVIEGQGTVGLEIFKDADFKIDYLLMAIGGGGSGGWASRLFSKQLSPKTQLIGVEPEGSPSMHKSMQERSRGYA